ncbi:MAG TPA: methylenetetrahydrofolate reductase [NAD(P)H] [Elusimicrobia bacterium]|nr:methylenetetrahydrofolate reductase [NAD(P)H] [Elusimicrobiota bacterium]
MRISEKLKKQKRVFSFEFYPPKKEEDIPFLKAAVAELKGLSPDFVSITQSPSSLSGLSFASLSNTLALSGVLKHEFSLEVMAHLTCITLKDRETLDEAVKLMRILGLENVLALRGDRAGGGLEKPFFSRAWELAAELNGRGIFDIAAACYPEKHPEAQSLEADIDNLKRKMDCGAAFAITQLFLDNISYFSFREKCLSRGVTIPLIPGIMPVTGVSQLANFAERIKVKIPAGLSAALEKLSPGGAEPGPDARAAIREFGVSYAAAQCLELLKNGAPGIHFYTLNRSKATAAVLNLVKRGLGII